MRTIAFRHEIDRLALGRMQRGMDRIPARQGNRRRRQALVNIGIVGGIPAQIGVADIAVKLTTQTIDNGRVGLQTHIPVQALDKGGRDQRALEGSPRFFFNDRGEYQGIVSRA